MFDFGSFPFPFTYMDKENVLTQSEDVIFIVTPFPVHYPISIRPLSSCFLWAHLIPSWAGPDIDRVPSQAGFASSGSLFRLANGTGETFTELSE